MQSRLDDAPLMNSLSTWSRQRGDTTSMATTGAGEALRYQRSRRSNGRGTATQRTIIAPRTTNRRRNTPLSPHSVPKHCRKPIIITSSNDVSAHIRGGRFDELEGLISIRGDMDVHGAFEIVFLEVSRPRKTLNIATPLQSRFSRIVMSIYQSTPCKYTLNGRCWLLWKALRALGFAERRSDWQRSEFEWLKAGGGPSLTGDIYEKPLHFKMNSVMAAPQGSNIGLWKTCDFFLKSAELSVPAIRCKHLLQYPLDIILVVRRLLLSLVVAVKHNREKQHHRTGDLKGVEEAMSMSSVVDMRERRVRTRSLLARRVGLRHRGIAAEVPMAPTHNSPDGKEGESGTRGVLALYGISAASSSSENREGVVWVPGIMKPLDNVRNLPILQRMISEDVAWILREKENGMSHPGESKDIEEIHTFSLGLPAKLVVETSAPSASLAAQRKPAPPKWAMFVVESGERAEVFGDDGNKSTIECKIRELLSDCTRRASDEAAYPFVGTKTSTEALGSPSYYQPSPTASSITFLASLYDRSGAPIFDFGIDLGLEEVLGSKVFRSVRIADPPQLEKI
ncbi:uncharacterized protein LACBIDRAFT_328257 [Laccaria bicolor S238N-H82]|uniref:Predicted protein n=1 Tax=Laccaria bicolor (strain S238N-H82 / ATCC MYA-4686) TaxID=486041 RepID=B0DEC1_LACBS|nr:uncharacterized protein LACBIDRAFT_328257 [Laccaria bicolor S238N-H82]EDR06904.1 predicted protein [Laccaria bicolor S238N-H82]|eukprot:XP_001882277.1 predicted protein [Laccaria bicolor S238N-H82]